MARHAAYTCCTVKGYNILYTYLYTTWEVRWVLSSKPLVYEIFLVHLGHTKLSSCCRSLTDSNFVQLELKWKPRALCLLPRAGLVTYKQHGELERCVAKCDCKKRTRYGGREEGHQGRVEWHIWQATLQRNVGFVYYSGLDCVCIYFLLLCIFLRIMFNLVARLWAPALPVVSTQPRSWDNW